MNIGKIEENITGLIQNLSQADFIYDLLLAYGLPKSSITRLKDGAYNRSKRKNDPSFESMKELLWKKKLFFREIFEEDLHSSIDQMRRDEVAAKHEPRFLIVTDYETILAYDTRTKDTLDIKLAELARHFDFFLPWAGREKAQLKLENPADVKAAEKMAKLYDLIRQDNPHQFLDKDSLHELNVFLSRLLFCYFAEDTEIFPKKLFVNSIISHTQSDGSDLSEYLDRLFDVLNTKHTERSNLPEYLKKFEYVNGGLFGKPSKAPSFSLRSRKMLIECGELNWSEINPDIFGSMIQAVVHNTDQRSNMGMHYTSVGNIMKVIEPLFLNELDEEFENSQHNPQKLDKLLTRLSNIRIFDPACGSGNFLIIAYKELRLLEIRTLKQLKVLNEAALGFDEEQTALIPKAQLSFAAAYVPQLFSRISLSQFYGIELDDFAHEIAILSLWLAEHQMNVKFNETLKKKLPSLPLKQGGKILWANATRVNWKEVCPTDDSHEIYVLGNPPFVGDKLQSPEQKEDLSLIFGKYKNSKAVDYITAWFMKAAEYIEDGGSFAFVATNSICQGIQVPLLWPHIFKRGLEIFFAHTSFAWANNAKNKAAVICCIVGVRKKSTSPRYIYSNENRQSVGNINAYLIYGPDVIVEKHPVSISGLPPMVAGNIPRDQGNLMFTDDEKRALITAYPEARKLIRQIMGSQEFINGILRWCLWIDDKDAPLAWSIPEIASRLERIKEYRIHGSERGQLGIDTPYKFERTIICNQNQIIVPRVSSERRKYIPIGFLERGIIISDAAQAIYDSEPFVFSLISSEMHMAWIKVTAGRMKSDYRYSSGVCYNSFPVPSLSEKQKVTLNQHAFNIIEEREKYTERTLAELYDPEKMPDGLREAHQALDQAVERCYRLKSFKDDDERLEYLFKLYSETVAGNNEGSLF